jgi:hypothetical protein
MTPILVGGTGRSGTTVLRTVLTKSKHIVAMPFELRIVVDPGGVLDLVRNLSDRWSPYNADMAVHRFRRMMRQCAHTTMPARALAVLLTRLRISPWSYSQVGIATVIGRRRFTDVVARLLDGVVHHTTIGSWTGSWPFRVNSRIYEAGPFQRQVVASMLSTFVHGLYDSIPTSKDSTHWVEDTPYNLLHADELHELFPDMRFVHIHRDPRDVLASYRSKAWGGDDALAIARRLTGVLERWFLVRERLPEGSFMEIALEELATDPDRHLRAVCDFVGVELEDTMMSISLSRANIGRWSRELSSEELTTVLPMLVPHINRLGYSL